MQYKVVGILGRRGSCKSLLAVVYLYQYYKLGKTIYSNIWLNFPYKKFTLDMLSTMPDELRNSVILIDEVQKWADAYRFFAKDSIALSNFVTQIRKLKVTLIITTQFARHTIVRLRDQFDNIIIMERASENDGIAFGTVLDATMPEGDDFVSDFYFDGRSYFDMYDTNEIVYGRDEALVKKTLLKPLTKTAIIK